MFEIKVSEYFTRFIGKKADWKIGVHGISAVSDALCLFFFFCCTVLNGREPSLAFDELCVCNCFIRHKAERKNVIKWWCILNSIYKLQITVQIHRISLNDFVLFMHPSSSFTTESQSSIHDSIFGWYRPFLRNRSKPEFTFVGPNALIIILLSFLFFCFVREDFFCFIMIEVIWFISKLFFSRQK